MKIKTANGNFWKILLAAFTLCCAPYTIADEPKHTEIPLFTPFNWAESNTGYIVKGTMCTHISKIGDKGCWPTTIVVDTPNKRLFIDLGKGGQYYVLKDSSFITGIVPGICFKVPGFTFGSQVTGYQNVLSTPGSTDSKATYIGLASDVGSCKEKIAASMTVQQGVLSEYDFDQIYPFPIIGLQHVTGMITLDPHTIDKTSDRSQYFNNMPQSCNNFSPNFCDTIYPPRNS